MLVFTSVDIPAVSSMYMDEHGARPEDNLYLAMECVGPGRVRGAPAAKAATTPTPAPPND
ncbi:hypothetical protein I2492_01470 [Budviciaceae bacterium CWB-B4]|uniref:Uncharacterized protein n=1 Tax=Limnobaculum xujianqingii TaxID=2738837 RepID=A0A9D7FQF7_9GAMM|nr:hypothetical protein [Limnobaculum xujianqingii]MBK5071684.1 hypothetical protein [Limnobaculum xujianqingii]MBK5174993.1 hypothetical protein [Limnobaculum xujianqingii]